MKTRYALLVAALFVAGCAGTTALPSSGTAPSASIASASTPPLHYRVFTAGKTAGFPADGFANDIAADPSGNVWFTDTGTHAIGRITKNGKVTEFSAGLNPGAEPYSIVAGTNGTMWFTDASGLALGSISPGGTIREFADVRVTNVRAQNIALDARGRPWIAASGPNGTLAFLSQSGRVVPVALPSGLSPNGSLASDGSGNLWLFAQTSSGGVTIVEHSPGSFSQIATPLQPIADPCCPNVAPKPMTLGNDGNIWFTGLYYGWPKYPGAKIVGTVRKGTVVLFRAKHNSGLAAFPSGIAAGGKRIWFTGGDPFQPNGALWEIDERGRQTVAALAYNPIGLTVDAAGNPWFTASFPGQPNRIVEILDLTPAAQTTPRL
ncbi:MAG TPA: hypothetical protein VMF61_11690 [Candidatus Acidoferrales bacterium]|nr:hypothetical protein [Candidatus Acidoferrales bacterium]